MDEFISREATIKHIKKVYCVGCNSYNGVRCRACGTGDAIDIIEDAPAADVAPVVRCKDCKYYKESRVLAPNKFCFRLNHPTEPRKIGYNFGDDDFCRYGERRDKP